MCLHSFSPCVGDCIFLPAGVVHAIGGGLVVAEIQQSSDTTWRLFDWNRVGPDGQPRVLHINEALDAIDYAVGPVSPVRPTATDDSQRERLVACDKFLLDRLTLSVPLHVADDDRCHIFSVLAGSISLTGDPASRPLVFGDTILLPARRGSTQLIPASSAVVLDAYLP